MGKAKGQKTKKVTKSSLMGTTSRSGETQVSHSTGLSGGIAGGQDAPSACLASQENTAPQVFDKKPGSFSTSTRVPVHQMFVEMSGCPADTETSPNDSCSLGEDDSSTEEDTSPSSGSDSNPQVGNGEASTPWINLFKDSRKPSKGFGLKFSPLSPEDVVLLDEDDF